MRLTHEKERLHSFLCSVENLAKLPSTDTKAVEMQAVVSKLQRALESANQFTQLWSSRTESAKFCVNSAPDPMDMKNIEDCKFFLQEYTKVSERLGILIQSKQQSLQKMAYATEYSRVSKLAVADAKEEFAVWKTRLQACKNQFNPDPNLIEQLELKIKVFADVFDEAIQNG